MIKQVSQLSIYSQNVTFICRKKELLSLTHFHLCHKDQMFSWEKKELQLITEIAADPIRKERKKSSIRQRKEWWKRKTCTIYKRIYECFTGKISYGCTRNAYWHSDLQVNLPVNIGLSLLSSENVLGANYTTKGSVPSLRQTVLINHKVFLVASKQFSISNPNQSATRLSLCNSEDWLSVMGIDGKQNSYLIDNWYKTRGPTHFDQGCVYIGSPIQISMNAQIW